MSGLGWPTEPTGALPKLLIVPTVSLAEYDSTIFTLNRVANSSQMSAGIPPPIKAFNWWCASSGLGGWLKIIRGIVPT